jgi:hypothetical protein
MRIEAIAGDVLQLASPLSGCALDESAVVAEGSVHTYRVDPLTRQLIRRDEATGSSNPMVDGVAAMTQAYFADPAGVDPVTGSDDGELMRARRVRVTLRFVAANPVLHIADFTVTIDVTPVNLSGG